MYRRRHGRLRKLTRADRLKRAARNERRGRTDRVVWNGQQRITTTTTRRDPAWFQWAKRRLEAM